jgi:hypothetical protein
MKDYSRSCTNFHRTFSFFSDNTKFLKEIATQHVSYKKEFEAMDKTIQNEFLDENELKTVEFINSNF